MIVSIPLRTREELAGQSVLCTGKTYILSLVARFIPRRNSSRQYLNKKFLCNVSRQRSPAVSSRKGERTASTSRHVQCPYLYHASYYTPYIHNRPRRGKSLVSRKMIFVRWKEIVLPSISALLNVYSGLKFHHFSKKMYTKYFQNSPLKRKKRKRLEYFIDI